MRNEKNKDPNGIIWELIKEAGTLLEDKHAETIYRESKTKENMSVY